MTFAPTDLFTKLKHLLGFHPGCERIWVAFSGGCDSHVLLYALAQIRERIAPVSIQAVHINHGLMNAADEWAEHCIKVCRALDVELKVVSVDAMAEAGESPEAVARAARYHVFADLLDEGEGLLLAHHEDDQAETVLLQLFRGAGVKGLAAMPEQIPFAKGWLARPLLDFSRQCLQDYALAESLSWIEDPSNQDQQFDRNFLRQQVIPQLLPRWPALNRCLSRSAQHHAAASQLLDELAQMDLEACCLESDVAGVAPISVSCLKHLSIERGNNVLRYWIRLQGLSLPDATHLERVWCEVLNAAADATPLVEWGNACVRRYRDQLYVLPASQSAGLKGASQWNNQQRIAWDLQVPLDLQTKGARLETRVHVSDETEPLSAHTGLRHELLARPDIQVRFRQGGEHCRPVGRGHAHSLKKLMQEWGVPPWERDRIPLIYVGEDIAQVVGYCICEPWQAKAGEKAIFVTESGI